MSMVSPNHGCNGAVPRYFFSSKFVLPKKKQFFIDNKFTVHVQKHMVILQQCLLTALCKRFVHNPTLLSIPGEDTECVYLNNKYGYVEL